MAAPLARATALLVAVVAFAGCTTSPSPQGQATQAREFHVVSGVLGFDDVAAGIPHDVFFPPTLVVNKGDEVTIRFHNVEDEPEDHTFTMTAPYAVDRTVAMNRSTEIKITASTTGVFVYRCLLHQPTMTGELVVLG